jgi:hypothetical protein
MFNDPCVLPRSEVRRVMEPAGEQKVVRAEGRRFDPSGHSLPCGWRDLELHRAMGLVLHRGCASSHLFPMANIAALQGHKVAPSQLAVNAEIEKRKFSDAAFHL